jgi:hypothetical protein
MMLGEHKHALPHGSYPLIRVRVELLSNCSNKLPWYYRVIAAIAANQLAN